MPQDFEVRDYVPNSGWPIRVCRSAAVVCAARARRCEIGPFQWNAEARAKATGTALLPTGAAIEHRYYQFSPPTRFARVYGGALEKAENVRVIAHANVTDIRLDENGGHVESFTCRTLAKTEFHVRANRYVLALGGIENPRVLLAARSQQPEGVANAHDVVGRYFMEHPHYYGSVGLVHLPELDRRFYTRMPSDLEAREWHARCASWVHSVWRQRSPTAKGCSIFQRHSILRKEDAETGALPSAQRAGARHARKRCRTRPRSWRSARSSRRWRKAA